MSYIGQGLPADTFQGFTTDSFTGDGSATTFTLSKEPFSEDTLIVVINNVIQKPTTNFTVSGTTLTIVGTAVASGDVIYAIHMGGPLPIGGASELDLNGASDKLVLDADGDTTISADTDDQIDIKIGGADDFAFKANNFEVQSGSTIDMNGQELILDADADTSITADTDDKIDFRCGGLDTIQMNKFGQIKTIRESATTFGGSINFTHQRGTTASPSIVNSGDTIGGLISAAYDGTAYLDGPRILLQVDGTPGDDDLPSRISFQVTADGTAGTLSEAMRISEDNKVGINIANSGTAMLKIYIPDSQYGIETLPAVNQTYYAAIFRNSSGNDVGRIEASASATSFVTSSDYRLKENVVTDWDATTRLKQLKPSRFNFINTPDTIVDGFLAHEVSSIVPEAISGDKDETKTKEKVVLNADGVVIAEDVKQINWTIGKEDGTFPTDSTWEASKVVPVYQAIDQSKLVPLLVKTVQELEARIKALEDA